MGVEDTDSNKVEKKKKRLNFVPGNRLGLVGWIQRKSPLAKYDGVLAKYGG